MSTRFGRSAAAYRASRAARFGFQPTVLALGIALVLGAPAYAQDTPQDTAGQTTQGKEKATELGAVSVTGTL